MIGSPGKQPLSVELTFRYKGKPVTIVHPEGTKGSGDDNESEVESRVVAMSDLRGAQEPQLHQQGFSLLRRPTALERDRFFGDSNGVSEIYYPEVAATIKEVLGCAEVIVFDHTIRIDDIEKQTKLGTRMPVGEMHNDFTRDSVRTRIKSILGEEKAAPYLSGEKRFGSVNMWRPLVDRVETKPLCFADAQSLQPSDFVKFERHYLNSDGSAVERIGGVLYLKPREEQHWFYFSHLTHDEAILLKCYDSDESTVPYTAHGSFRLPDEKGKVPRESIECRTLFFF